MNRIPKNSVPSEDRRERIAPGLTCICGPAEGFRGHAVAAHRERQARRLDHIARNMQVMPKACLQQTADLTDRDPDLGHRELHLGRPGVAQGAPPVAQSVCGRLQAGELIEQAARDHLAGDAALDQRGRRLERFDHDIAGGEGIVQHHRDAGEDGQRQ